MNFAGGFGWRGAFWIVYKMEYKYKKWDQAGETRLLDININGHVSYKYRTAPYNEVRSLYAPFNNFTQSKIEMRGYSTMLVAQFQQDARGNSPISWNYDLSFKIAEMVKNVPETRRVSQFRFN